MAEKNLDAIKAFDTTVSSSEILNKQSHKDIEGDPFELFMRKEHSEKIATDAIAQTSPIEEAHNNGRKTERVGNVSSEDLTTQAKSTIEQIEQVKQTLATPDLKIPRSVNTLLRSKLTHIDESLKIALSKAGVEYTPPEQPKGLITPIEQFFGYLTHGQYELQHLSEKIEQMHIKKEELSASSMLAIQIKVGYIQQQLEFFTSLLNKALESTKTLMNVQV